MIAVILLLLFATTVYADVHDSWDEVKTSFINLTIRWRNDVGSLWQRIRFSEEWIRFTARLSAWDELVGSVKQLGSVTSLMFRYILEQAFTSVTSEEVVNCLASLIRLFFELVIISLACLIRLFFELIIHCLGLSEPPRPNARNFRDKSACPPSVTAVCRESCEFLKVKEGLTAKDVRGICRRLSGLWHPDRHIDERHKDFSNQIFFKVRKSCEEGHFRFLMRNHFENYC